MKLSSESEMIESLQARLAEMQRQVQQETRLRQAAEAALAESKGRLKEFISLASHDVGTPLTPLISYADLYLNKWQDRGDAEALELLETVKSEAGRALCMLRALAGYARVGYLARPSQPVATGELLELAVAELQLQHPALEWPLCRDPLPALRVPGPYLKRIWMILLDNVIRHAGPRPFPVEVGASRKQQKVRLFVKDHGAGVPAEMAEEIFQLFPRGPDGQGKSAGVGLATLKKIAGYYGGRAWVEPTPGGGCTFRVEFSEEPQPGEGYAL